MVEKKKNKVFKSCRVIDFSCSFYVSDLKKVGMAGMLVKYMKPGLKMKRKSGKLLACYRGQLFSLQSQEK